MKVLVIISLFLFSFCSVFSQSIGTSTLQTFKIEDAAIELKQSNWYQTQAELWEDNVNSNPKNADAWLNYYQAIRFSFYSASSKEVNKTQQAKLDAILDKMEANISESFEYNYLKFVNSDQNPEYFTFLEKAYQKEPDNSLTYDDFIAYYELTGNLEKKDTFCSKLKNANTFCADIFNYNYNVLMSLEKNAILFTNGTLDTYPLWILQQTMRSDVTVLNIDLLKNEKYLKAKLSALHLIGDSAIFYVQEPDKFYTYITTKNPNKNLYFSLTIPVENLKNISAKLYSTGLALKYAAGDYNNIDVLQSNMLLFNITGLFDEEKKSETSFVNKMNLNYIVPITALFRYYMDIGETEKAGLLKSQAIILAKRSGKEDFVRAYFVKLIKQ